MGRKPPLAATGYPPVDQVAEVAELGQTHPPELIARVLHWAADRVPAEEIALTLAEGGLSDPQGRRYGPQTIRRIVQRARAAGWTPRAPA